LSDSELTFPGSASGRLISAGDGGRHGGRERHSNFIRLVSPVRRDGRRHGQTHFVFSEQARDGRTAGLSPFRSRPDGVGLRVFG